MGQRSEPGDSDSATRARSTALSANATSKRADTTSNRASNSTSRLARSQQRSTRHARSVVEPRTPRESSHPLSSYFGGPDVPPDGVWATPYLLRNAQILTY